MEWKTIIGNKHEVSRDGRVRNKKTKRELKADMSGGYKRVLIVVDGVRTHQAIHRLVATAFCENKNPQEFIYVNHIDENKLNNNADNLEWVSPSQNTSHGTARQRASLKTKTSRAREKEIELLEGEEWIETKIKGYSVSNKGRCKSKRGILKPEEHTSGYFRIAFSKYGRFYVHRLVAEYFLPKEEGKDIVNHKDGNKRNNQVENLEWVSSSENLVHYYNNK